MPPPGWYAAPAARPRRRRGCWWLVLVPVTLLLGWLVLAVLVRLTDRPAPAPAPTDWSSPTAIPQSPALPLSRLAFDSDRGGNYELYTMGYDGAEVTRLTRDPSYDSWSPRLSPDRRTILFHRTPAGVHDLDAAQTSLWAVGVDGTGLVQLRPVGTDGWVLQGHAEWSPDGRRLVMFGGSRINPQIHVTDALGRQPKALTARPGTNLDPVFSPDGTSIAFVGCPRAVCTEPNYEIYVMPATGGDATRVTDDGMRDHDPMWSPDGRRLAWLTQISLGLPGTWDVRIAIASGRAVDASTATRLVGDNGITSRPEFTPDGSQIVVHRIPPGGTRFGIYRIPVAGGPLVEITQGHPGNNEYPSP